MKKVFLSIVMIVTGSLYLNSQIKISSTGKVGMNGYEPITAYNLNLGSAQFHSTAKFLADIYQGKSGYFRGTIKFRPAAGSVWLQVDNSGYYGATCLRPSNNYCISLGRSGDAFHDVHSYQFITPSDKRQKENIRKIDSPLDKIMSIKGVKYDLRREYTEPDSVIKTVAQQNYREKERKDYLGFIAQDLQKVIPEAVVYDDSADVYGVNYISIIPLLVEALKEQQKQIQRLQWKRFKTTEDLQTPNENYLGKNYPNPFDEQTSISFFLSPDVKDASLYIYNLTGKQIKRITVVQRDKGEIIIHANELEPGMYKYSLIGDGQVIGTETMILTN